MPGLQAMSTWWAWVAGPQGTTVLALCALVLGMILGWLHATRSRRAAGDEAGPDAAAGRHPAGRHRAGGPLPAAGRLPLLAEGEGRRVWAELMANDRPRPDAIPGALAVIRVARGGRPVPDVPSPPWVPSLVPPEGWLAAGLPHPVRYDGSYDANGWDEGTVFGPAERALLMPRPDSQVRTAATEPGWPGSRGYQSLPSPRPDPDPGPAGEELFGTAWTRQAALDLAAWMDEHVYGRPGTYAEITARLDGQP